MSATESTPLLENQPQVQSRCLPSCCYNEELTKTFCPLSSAVIKTYTELGEDLIEGCCNSSSEKYNRRTACCGATLWIISGIPQCIGLGAVGGALDCLYCTAYGMPSSCYKHCKKAEALSNDADLV